jgi:predicted nucleic acid-binding protein
MPNVEDASALSPPLLIDNSAWARLTDGALPEWRVAAFAQELEERRLGVCLPFVIEAEYSMVNADHGYETMTELEKLPRFPIDEEVERWALSAHGQLVRVGHRRISTVDIVIAAIAHHFRTGVLHYNSDFDLLLAKTHLEFVSEWLMPAGSLN